MTMYLDYLMANPNQLEGASPKQVMRMAGGVFIRPPQAFSVHPIAPEAMPRRIAPPPLETGGGVGGRRVG
jgi:hypothetical protein